MRLWHEALIPFLPRQQLLGQHRELCALRGLGWGKKHKTVDYIFQHPFAWLVAYHGLVIVEMHERGYNVDERWKDIRYRGQRCPMDLSPELPDLIQNRLTFRKITGIPVYPEHDDAYLQECLDNLEGKGIHIKDRWG